MNKDFFIQNRNNYLKAIEDNSITILFSGHVIPKTADQDFPFEVNKNFYYLTGINQAEVVLVLLKGINGLKEYLFIEENDEVLSKWVGKKLSKEEASEISGIKVIGYLNELEKALFSLFNNTRKNFEIINYLYLDLERRNQPYYSTPALEFIKDFTTNYPEIAVKNAYNTLIGLRMIKSKEEITLIKASIATTKLALENILDNLKPNMYEYEVETYFDSVIKQEGNKDKAFETICAAGKNATILHYVDNNAQTKKDDLILFDLGCRTNFYVSDISRTYPVGKKFTPRQAQIYEIVLETNKKCIEFIRPGITWDDYNGYANSLLIAGLRRIGLINEDSELMKYYWHTVGHMIGLDTHDPVLRNVRFQEGMVMTVEPGLYLEEEGIGIRIEDNVLVTKDGAINLSKEIIKEIKDIEDFMNK